ncbi:Phosphoglycolate phosphatase [subsurface metagenome]
MIKAIFFDWVGTLAHPEPDSHEIVQQVAKGLGVELPPRELRKGLHVAENQMPSGAPPRWEEGKDEGAFLRWWVIVLAEVGVKVSREKLSSEIMLGMTRRLSRVSRNLTWVLYDDVLPTIKKLKKRGLILGLISNLPIAKSASASLEPYLDFVVTSNEAGASKPESPVFLMALEQAGVNGSEAVYVGDQYQTDVVGARAVGIKPILIDRFDLEREFSDCSRIYRLSEVTQYL